MMRHLFLASSLVPIEVIAVLVALTPTPTLYGAETNYTELTETRMSRQGCLDPDSRERQPNVDAIFVSVDRQRVIDLTVIGDEQLEPGLFMIADDGYAADLGWMREVGGPSHTLHTTVILPTAGRYTFIIADRRELDGDEMAAGRGCFSATLNPRRAPPTRTLPPVWRGPIDAPVSFAVPTLGGGLVLVEVENPGTYGAVMLTVFEDDSFNDTQTIAPGDSARMLFDPRGVTTHLLVEEAINTRGAPLTVVARAVAYGGIPDDEHLKGVRFVTTP